MTSKIITTSSGVADAGDIELDVDHTIRLIEESRLSTESVGGGGGKIYVKVKDLLYLKDSTITTAITTGGKVNSGDIFVDPDVITIEESSIQTSVQSGVGGHVRLIGMDLNIINGSDITTAGDNPDGSGQIELIGTQSISFIGTGLGGEPNEINTRNSGIGDAGSFIMFTDNLTTEVGNPVLKLDAAVGQDGVQIVYPMLFLEAMAAWRFGELCSNQTPTIIEILVFWNNAFTCP